MHSDCSIDQLFCLTLLLLEPAYSLRHNNIEIRPISNCAVSSKGSSERKRLEALILHEKLEIIKLSKEGMSKA